MPFRAAVVQIGSVPFDKEATVDKVIRYIQEGAATGAKLLVFPEALVSAYPKGADFGARVGGSLAARARRFPALLQKRDRRSGAGGGRDRGGGA